MTFPELSARGDRGDMGLHFNSRWLHSQKYTAKILTWLAHNKLLLLSLLKTYCMSHHRNIMLTEALKPLNKPMTTLTHGLHLFSGTGNQK